MKVNVDIIYKYTMIVLELQLVSHVPVLNNYFI